MTKPNSQSPNLTLDTKAFVDALAAQNSAPLYTLTPEQARQVLIDAQSKPVPQPDCRTKDIELPVGPTGKVDVRIYRHREGEEKLPLLLYIHGGGWIMGNKQTHERLVRELCAGSGAVVLYPNYTPSPDAQFPVPLEQIYAALCHVVDNADKFGIDPTRIAVAGDSAGGNMATVIAMMAKEKNGPKIGLQVLLYPVTNYGFDTESYTDFADGPWLTKKAMEWFWKAYCPDQAKAKDPHVSPLQASTDQLRGLPAALVITDENDVLRDEGEAYARKMIEAGVQVASVRANGTHHDFMMLNALADTAPCRAAILLANAALKKAFGGCGCSKDGKEGHKQHHKH